MGRARVLHPLLPREQACLSSEQVVVVSRTEPRYFTTQEHQTNCFLSRKVRSNARNHQEMRGSLAMNRKPNPERKRVGFFAPPAH
jgi:hypothetical protein